jgi:hypothetical protein
MASTTPVLVRLSPEKYAFVASEAERLGVPVATVLQMWISEKMTRKTAACRANGSRPKTKKEVK